MILKTRFAVLFMALIYFFSIKNIQAATWKIGPGQSYTNPSEVMTLVNDGDTILIDAAEYIGDVGAWTNDDLVIIGVGGRPHLRANGNYAWGKGIWVAAGNNMTVENVEFSEASVPDMNGAGIRLDGIGLTIRDCYFHDNENGILTSNPNAGDVLVEHSEFNRNGYGDGFSHGIYVGHVNSFTLRHCYMHHAYVGHNVKSRAQNNYILYNRIMDENNGESSSLLDLPNGGFSVLIGNLFMQSNVAQNNRLISYGVEGLTNTINELYAVNNTLVNERFNGQYFQLEDDVPVAKIINNLFVGKGTLVTGNVSTEFITNLQIEDNTSHPFSDYDNFDYHLRENTAPIDAGTSPGMAGTYSLTPGESYFHPVGTKPRYASGPIDIGAYEYQFGCTTYFVSNSGSDSNTGLSLNEAFLTLQHAANIVETGDSVFVENGTYTGFDLRDKNGAANKPIVFQALSNNALINQSGPIRNDGINIENADYIILDGFISNDMIGNGNGIRLALADNCVVRNCRCDNNAERGIFTAFTDDILIENNICSNSIDEHGIYVSNSSDRPIIRYNECFGNNNIGIHMNADLSQGGDGIISDAQVYGNILHDNNLAAGINMDGLENPIVYNNLIYNNHSAQGIALFQADGAVVTSGAKIYNNTIIVPSDGRWGILLKDGANVNTEIYNNIIINQHAWRGCIAVESTSQLTSDYNILNDKMSDSGDDSSIGLAAWQALGFDGNSILAGSLASIFVDQGTGDYQLITASPAIDAGTNLVNAIIMDDLNRNSRPSGSDYDIGAYEYFGPVAVTTIHTQQAWQLYPNPFSESAVLVFENAEEKNLEIKIHHIDGRYLKSLFLNGEGQTEISREGMTSGVYLFYVLAKGEFVGVGKFGVE